MTPEGRAIWKSPGGVSLLTAWLEKTPLTPEAQEALAALKALNEKNGIRPLPRASGEVTGVQLEFDFGSEHEFDNGSRQTSSEVPYPRLPDPDLVLGVVGKPPKVGTFTPSPEYKVTHRPGTTPPAPNSSPPGSKR